MIQSKPSEKGEIITYLSQMGDVLHHIPKWSKLIFTVIAVYTVIHRNETDIVFREEGVCVVPNTEIISAKPGHIFLCQVGTKKF